MKTELLLIRIEQVMALAMASPCCRSQHAAILLDPEDNMVLLDGFNAPVPASLRGPLCGGTWCERNGLSPDDLEVVEAPHAGGFYVAHRGLPLEGSHHFSTAAEAELDLESFAALHPAVAFGNAEIGCLCAERRLLFAAARRGISCADRWIVCTGIPCLACARALLAARVAKVVAIADSYDDARGLELLRDHDVEVDTMTLASVREMGRQIRSRRSA